MKQKRIFSLLLSLTLLACLLMPCAFAVQNQPLSLREDWRLTDDLDLAVPAGTNLVIDGKGDYHIYEMSGKLMNSGAGTVTFADGTILYPAGESGLCSTETSNALMVERHSYRYTVTVSTVTGGSVTTSAADGKAGEGETVTVTATAYSGYTFSGLTVTAQSGQSVPVSGSSFVMPAEDVTVTAAFAGQSGGGSSGGSSGSAGVSGTGSNVTISAAGGAVTASQIESAVTKADEGAVITIQAESASAVMLPAGGMAKAADNGSDVRVAIKNGEIMLSAQAIAGLTSGISADSRVEVSVTSSTSSTDDDLAALLEQGAAVFELSIKVDGKSVHSFGGTLTLTFTVPNLDKIEDPHVLHILNDGSREYYVPDSVTQNTVTVKGIRNLSTFAVIPGSEVPQEQANPFADVNTGDYYYDAVLWAASSGVTAGTSDTLFSPDAAVTRAQMVTFLWRAYGSPKAVGQNPFADVSTGDYYYDAVLWAVENKITAGTSAAAFSPEDMVTRAQAVAFQWRAAGSPVVSGSGFADVAADAYYANAVAWAVENGITVGTDENTFSPDMPVSRAQAVTFLYRQLA